MKKYIVKVQLSLSTSEPQQMCLVYNKDRTRLGQFPASKELKKAMHGRQKAFFWGADKGSEIELFEEAKWQGW